MPKQQKGVRTASSIESTQVSDRLLRAIARMEKRHDTASSISTRSKGLLDITNQNENIRPTKMSRKTDMRKKSDRIKYQSPEISSTESAEIGVSMQIEAGVDFIETVQATLIAQYFNMAARLNLSHPPRCLSDLVKCEEQHFKNENINRVTAGLKKCEAILYQQPDLMLLFIDGILAEKEFPNELIIMMILELILTEKSDAANNRTVERGILILSKIIEQFPPCWDATQSVYRAVLLKPLDNFNNLLRDFDKKRSLIANIFEELEDLLDPKNYRAAIRAESEVNDSLNFKAIFVSEWVKNQKKSFDALSHGERIERLFLALHLLTYLLENDFAMWMIKYSDCLHETMQQSNATPLIVSVLWSKSEPRQVNNFIKQILRIFVSCVNIDASAERVAILSRLITLIHHTFYFCVNGKVEVEREVHYPAISKQNQFLCQALEKAIYASSSYSLDFYIKIIDCVADHSLKLQLIKALLTKAYHRDVELNMTSILLELRELDKNIETELNKRDKKKRRNYTTNLSPIQFAEVYLNALIAYVELYHIKNVRSALLLNRNIRQGSANITSEPFQLTTNNITAVQKSPRELKKRRKLNQKPTDELFLVSDKHMLKSGTIEKDKVETNEDASKIIVQDLSKSKHKLPLITISGCAQLAVQYREDIKVYDIIKQDNELGSLKTHFKHLFVRL